MRTRARPGPGEGLTVRVLLAGWFSFLNGEVTAGDVLALEAVRRSLGEARIGYEVAWSPAFRPDGLRLEDAPPRRFTHLVFVCGPLHGEPFTALHARFAPLRRIAVGVTVIDPADPAYTGFDLVLARDGGPGPPVRDLAAAVVPRGSPPVPVTGIALAMGQGEYGGRRRHEAVAARLTEWVGGKECAPVTLETRLDPRDWRLCSTAEAFEALLSRLDIVVTTHLHGLALALRAGIPVLAVDPVEGDGKVTAQASAWRWPAVLAAGQASDRACLDAMWDWCLSTAGRQAAAAAGRAAHEQADGMLTRLITSLRRAAAGP